MNKKDKRKIPWNKGLKTGKQTKETIKKRSLSLMGHFVSEKTRMKISEAQKGEKAHNWKGGISFIKRKLKGRNKFYPDYKYKYSGNALNAMKIDKFKCIHCSSRNNLVVHHWNKDKKDNRIKNLITLCRSCHAKLHNINRDIGKQSKVPFRDGLRLAGQYLFTLRNAITGQITSRQMRFNLIPTTGRTMLANNLTDTSPDNTMLVSHVALGTGTSAPANGDTTLETETFRNAVASRTNGNNIAYITGFYGATEVTGTFREVGVFSDGSGAADSGILLSRVAINITKSNSESLTIDWSLTIQ